MKSFSKKQDAIEYCKTNSEYRLYAEDYIPKTQSKIGMKKFWVAKPLDMYSHIVKLQLKDRAFYEFWSDHIDHKVALVIDVDIKNPTSEDVKEMIIAYYIDNTIKLLKEQYQIGLEPDHFIITDSSRLDKISFHIKCKHIRFRDMDQQAIFWHNGSNYFPSERYLFDFAIYKLSMPLRMAFCHKRLLDPNQIYQSIPRDKADTLSIESCFKYSMIHFDNPSEVIDIKELELTINPLDDSFRPKKEKKPNNEQVVNTDMNRYNNYIPNYPPSPLREPMRQLKPDRAIYFPTWCNVCFGLKNASTEKFSYYETFIEFSKQYTLFNEEDCKKKWNEAKTKTETQKMLYGKQSIIRWAIQDNPMYVYIEPLRDLFQEAEENKFWGVKVEEINQKYIADVEFGEYKTVYLKSGQGSSKSSAAVKFMAMLKAELGKKYQGAIVCISRKNLATTISSFAKKGYYGYEPGMPIINIENYANIPKGDYHSTENICITPNSILHLAANGKFAHRTFFWIDEAKPWLAYLCSRNLDSNRKAVVTTLVHFLKTVDYLLVTDADLASDELKILQDIRGKPAKLIWNKFNSDQNEYHLVTSYNRLISRCLDLIKDGKNLYICCDTKSMTKKLAHIFSGCLKKDEMVVYNSDTELNVRQMLENINEEWSKLRCVISNSVNEYGIDFSDYSLGVQCHFHTVFAIFKGNTITSQGANQLLHRVRHTRSSTIYIHLDNIRYRYYSTDLNDIRKMLILGAKSIDDIMFGEDHLIKQSVNKLIGQCDFKIDDEGNIVQCEQLFCEILTRTLRTVFESLNNFRGWLKFYITSAGGKIITDEYELNQDAKKKLDEDVEDFRKKIDNYTEYNNDTEISGILNANDLNTYEIQNLVKAGISTNEDRYKFKKWSLKKSTGIINVDEEIVRYYVENPEFVNQIENFKILMEDKWKDNVLDRVGTDFKVSIGIIDDAMKIKKIVEMMELLGWNTEIDFEEKKEYMGGKFGEVAEKNILDYFVKNKKLLQVYFRDSGRMYNKKKDITVYMDFVIRLLNKQCGKLIKKDNIRVQQNLNRNRKWSFQYNISNDECQNIEDDKTSVIMSECQKVLKKDNNNMSIEDFLTKKIKVIDQKNNTHDECQNSENYKSSVNTSEVAKLPINNNKNIINEEFGHKKIKVIDVEKPKKLSPKNGNKNRNTPKMLAIKAVKAKKAEAKKEYNSLDSMMEWWVASIINSDKIEYEIETIPSKLNEFLLQFNPESQWGDYTGITGNLRENLVKYLTEIKEEKMTQEDLEENIFS